MEGDQNSPRGYPTLEHIPVLAVACLILLDTSCPMLAMISGVLLVVDLLLYMYCNPPRADPLTSRGEMVVLLSSLVFSQ